MKWTVATVNYYTKDWYPFWLKSLYEFNDPAEFELIIVNNCQENIDEFYSFGSNIRIFNNPGHEMPGGWWHGHDFGLNVAKYHARSEYFLAQDPDFFWLAPNYLKILEGLLISCDVVGASHFGDAIRDEKGEFPRCWGCAYRLSAIQHLDFELEWDEAAKKTVMGRDVGWKITEAFWNKPYVAFKPMLYCGPRVEHGEGWAPYEYYFGGKRIAVHMCRVGYINKDQPPTPTQAEARQILSERFYKVLQAP